MSRNLPDDQEMIDADAIGPGRAGCSRDMQFSVGFRILHSKLKNQLPAPATGDAATKNDVTASPATSFAACERDRRAPSYGMGVPSAPITHGDSYGGLRSQITDL